MSFIDMEIESQITLTQKHYPDLLAGLIIPHWTSFSKPWSTLSLCYFHVSVFSALFQFLGDAFSLQADGAHLKSNKYLLLLAL